jgi:outer membrane protein OmpA-like peptidoglycan-associated protein
LFISSEKKFLIVEPTMSDNGGHDPHLSEEKPMVSRFLPWLVLLLAALALFYFLNRGCIGAGDTNASVDNPKTDTTISGVVKENIDAGSAKEVTPVAEDNSASQGSRQKGTFLQQVERQFQSGEANPNEPLILDYGDFQGRSSMLTPQSEKELEHFVTLLKKYPAFILRIEAHTDNQGKADINKQLSTQQALAVRTFLEERGIARDRLDSVGRGQTKPLTSNDTEAGREMNKRIEIYLTGVK